MKVFVVTMYRWGERSNHSYVLGVWTSGRWAITHAITEQVWKGFKYKAEVERLTLNEKEPPYSEVVYGDIKNSISEVK